VIEPIHNVPAIESYFRTENRTENPKKFQEGKMENFSVSHLDDTGFVDDADGMFSGVCIGDDFLKFVSHFFVIPVLVCEEPLDGPGGHFGLESDGFAVFSRKMTILPTLPILPFFAKIGR